MFKFPEKSIFIAVFVLFIVLLISFALPGCGKMGTEIKFEAVIKMIEKSADEYADAIDKNLKGEIDEETLKKLTGQFDEAVEKLLLAYEQLPKDNMEPEKVKAFEKRLKAAQERIKLSTAKIQGEKEDAEEKLEDAKELAKDAKDLIES